MINFDDLGLCWSIYLKINKGIDEGVDASTFEPPTFPQDIKEIKRGKKTSKGKWLRKKN